MTTIQTKTRGFLAMASSESYRNLAARQRELKGAIDGVLQHLLPEGNRRSGRDRRAGSAPHPERRREDRRLPLVLRLRLLRLEFQEVLRRQEELRSWKQKQLTT